MTDLSRDASERLVTETSTGKPGILRIDDDGIEVRLTSFDGSFVVDETEAVVLAVADATVVSLHSVYTASAVGFTEGAGGRTVHTQDIGANYAIEGASAWMTGSTLRQASFVVPGADGLLRHDETYRSVLASRMGSAPIVDLFRVRVPPVTISARYSMSGAVGAVAPARVWPVVTMEFDEGIGFERFLAEAFRLQGFLSACLARPLAIADVSLFTLTGEEYAAASAAERSEARFGLRFVPGERPAGDGGWIGRSFASLHDDGERAAFEACLAEWLETWDGWEAANLLMMRALSLADTASPERLLNASKWLESTPGAGARPALSQEDVDSITAAAVAEARALGHGELQERVRGALSYIGGESNRNRWQRLIAEVGSTFGADVVDDRLLDDLRMASRLRGSAAHSHLEVGGGSDFRDFIAAVAAVECLAYLLMLKRLPVSDGGRARVRRSTLVQSHRNAAGST